MNTNCFRTTFRLLGLALLSASIAAPALAQQSSDKFVDFFRRTELSGFVDGYYGYNFNTPATRKAGPEPTFDVTHNSSSLNLAEISLERNPPRTAGADSGSISTTDRRRTL